MKLWSKLKALFAKRRLEREMATEMQAHLDGLTERNIAKGMSPKEARYAAHRAFGGVEQIKERARDERGMVWIDLMIQDLRRVFRSILRFRGISLACITVLGVAIGANTAVYTIIDTVLFRTLPVVSPDELFILAKPKDLSPRSRTFFSYPAYEAFSIKSHSLRQIAAFGSEERTYIAGVGPDAEGILLQSEAVSSTYFTTLGIHATVGRLFSEDDNRSDSSDLQVILSFRFWTENFGSDASVLGKSINIDGTPLIVVGITPKSFRGLAAGNTPDIWIPLETAMKMDGEKTRRFDEKVQWLRVFGRLNSGTTPTQGGIELALINRQVSLSANQARIASQEVDTEVVILNSGGSGYNNLFQQNRRIFTGAILSVGVVLAIACVNVMGLLFAQTTTRRNELAVRSALGASRPRLIIQLLVETLVVTILGGILGVGIAISVLPIASEILLPGFQLTLSINLRVLYFAFGVSLLTGLIAGIWPALYYCSGHRLNGLNSQTSLGGIRGRGLGANVGGIIQVSLTVLLLIGAGLFVRTLLNLNSVDLGFKRSELLLCRLDLAKDYRADIGMSERLKLYQEVSASVQNLPGVTHVSIAEWVLLGTQAGAKFQTDSFIPFGPDVPQAHLASVGPDFFECMGIPIINGRSLTSRESLSSDEDSRDSICPVVIGEAMARRFFGTTNPVGQRVKIFLRKQPDIVEVVGVAKDVKIGSLRDSSPYVVYLPYFRVLPGPPRISFQVRTDRDAAALAMTFRALLWRIAPNAKISYLETMNNVVAKTISPERAMAKASVALGLLALLIGCFGLYSFFSFEVAQRTREIGLRMAVGASVPSILRLVLARGFKVVALGGAIGVITAIVVYSSYGDILFGVTSFDMSNVILVAGVLTLATGIAAWLPARRAAKVDPMEALRCE